MRRFNDTGSSEQLTLQVFKQQLTIDMTQTTPQWIKICSCFIIIFVVIRLRVGIF